MNEIWIWLVLGLVPYRVRHRYTRSGERVWTVQALFWSVHIEHQCSGHYDWAVQVPLIERLRDAVWAAVLRLRGAEPQERA